MLVGTATPPVLLSTLLEKYLAVVALEEPDEGFETREVHPAKRAKPGSPETQTSLLAYFKPPLGTSMAAPVVAT